MNGYRGRVMIKHANANTRAAVSEAGALFDANGYLGSLIAFCAWPGFLAVRGKGTDPGRTTRNRAPRAGSPGAEQGVTAREIRSVALPPALGNKTLPPHRDSTARRGCARTAPNPDGV